MPDDIVLTKSAFSKLIFSGFPLIGRGQIVDPDALSHWIQQTTVPGSSARADVRSPRWAAMAAKATIERALAQQQFADRLGSGSSEAMLTANRSDIAQAVDALLETPPRLDRLTIPPWPPPWPWPWPGPWPWPPPWQDRGPVPDPWERGIPGVDLLVAGAQFQVVADSREPGPLREEFAAAADRFFEVGLSRL